MKIAIIGAGISGIAAASRLQHDHHVWLYEASARLGGHTDTHLIQSNDRTYAIDTGFIVFNDANYPRLSAWLQELGIPSQPSDMSFSVCNQASGLEYGTASLRALFCQMRNAVTPDFLSLLMDLRRFYREAPNVLACETSATLGDYLGDNGYRPPFVRDHVLPMCAAIWSQPAASVRSMPIRHLVEFLTRHALLQVYGRPQWRVVTGGSAAYVDAFQTRFRGRMLLATPVDAVQRRPGSVSVSCAAGTQEFDAVIMACHSDQALALLADASPAEREILGAIPYHANRALLHSDSSVMPRNRRAWSSWNARVPRDAGADVSVSYWSNRLQSIPGPQQFFVTLNPLPDSAPQRVWAERQYRHPVFSTAAVAAQQRLAEIQGSRNTWFCGAWCGWGFHEDGFASGRDVAELIGRRGATHRAA
jgi:uncharacterized protein